MAEITIDQDKCKGCLLCIGACPKGLIKKSAKLNKRGANPVEFSGSETCLPDRQACLGCMLCALICPECCIEVYK